jgi:hypothetical protein
MKMLGTPRTLTAAAAAAACAALAALPATASAEATPIGGGSTTLALNDGAAEALQCLEVSVAPVRPASASDEGVSFPITGGRLDGAKGVLRHSGGLRFKKGGARIALTDFTTTLKKKKSVLSAKVNRKARVTAFSLDLRDAEVDDSGIGPVISGVGLVLNRKGAAALNATFDTDAFSAGLDVGTLTVSATPRAIRLVGGQTDLMVDEDAASALASEGISPGLEEGTVANEDGSLGFPITGGRVNAKTLGGRIAHDGGISLTKGETVVRLTDFVIDTRRATLSATVDGGSQKVAILALDLDSPDVTIEGKQVTVAGVTATLTKAAADALNAAFETEAFTEGLTLGVATVRGEAA